MARAFSASQLAEIASLARRSGLLALALLCSCHEAHAPVEMRQPEPAADDPFAGNAGHAGAGGGMAAGQPAASEGPSQWPSAPPSATKTDAATDAACRTLTGAAAERWLAFDSDREGYNRDLYLVRGDGSELMRLTQGGPNESEPAFTLDGERMAYVSDASGTAQIYIRDMSSGESEQLTQRAGGADQPSWSSDGEQLVFHSGRGIYIMNADGSGERMLGEGPDDFNAYKYPSLTPDGKSVVFDRNNEINAIDVDGGDQRYVVRNWTTTEETPAISPDGFNVAFAVWCGFDPQSGGKAIGVVPLAGPAPNPCDVTFATSAKHGDARRPAWGPDDLIAFERSNPDDPTFGGTRIALTAGSERAPCDLVASPGHNRNPNWAPEGFQP